MPDPKADPTCREIVEIATGYLEGTLPEGQRRQFERHIRLCPDCGTYLAQMRQTIDNLGELREESLTADQRDQLLDAFRGWRRNLSPE